MKTSNKMLIGLAIAFVIMMIFQLVAVKNYSAQLKEEFNTPFVEMSASESNTIR